MRRFANGGITFYLLEPGESGPDLNKEYLYIPGYMIKPVEGGWKALCRAIKERDWHPLSDRLFSSENEAFYFAHEHFLEEQRNSERLLPGWKST